MNERLSPDTAIRLGYRYMTSLGREEVLNVLGEEALENLLMSLAPKATPKLKIMHVQHPRREGLTLCCESLVNTVPAHRNAEPPEGFRWCKRCEKSWANVENFFEGRRAIHLASGYDTIWCGLDYSEQAVVTGREAYALTDGQAWCRTCVRAEAADIKRTQEQRELHVIARERRDAAPDGEYNLETGVWTARGEALTDAYIRATGRRP